jgi:hypothetical protein
MSILTLLGWTAAPQYPARPLERRKMKYQELVRRNDQLRQELEDKDREIFHWVTEQRSGRLRASVIGCAIGAGLSVGLFSAVLVLV